MTDLSVAILTVGIPTVIASFTALAYLYWSVKRTERRFGEVGMMSDAAAHEHIQKLIQQHSQKHASKDIPTSGLAREGHGLAHEGIALNRAFASITDPKLRADVVAHVEAVARYHAARSGLGWSDD